LRCIYLLTPGIFYESGKPETGVGFFRKFSGKIPDDDFGSRISDKKMGRGRTRIWLILAAFSKI
jgi:hypothetical protein